jgi:hypothetical protein
MSEVKGQVMGDYTTAIMSTIGVGIVITAAVVFALMRPSDLPTIDENRN